MKRDDLRTRIAKTIAGPHISDAFGKLTIGPATAAAVRDAYRQADAVLGCLHPEIEAIERAREFAATDGIDLGYDGWRRYVALRAALDQVPAVEW